MQPPQIIVTSYCRLKYLKRTVESLRLDDVAVYIVDGGSDEETRDFIRKNADAWLFLNDNPGADTLKTEGIKKFVTNREFIITSDDLVYPPGYSTLLMEQYRRLNKDSLRWNFCACNLAYIEKMTRTWQVVNGVELREEKILQVAGAVVDRDLCRVVGYFPTQYGRSGQGDRAFSKRLHNLGVRMCYFRRPMIHHIGDSKAVDFPEYTKAFNEDEARWIKLANEDALA